MRRYWFGLAIETDWIAGRPWSLTFPDGRLAVSGEILGFDVPRRIELTWKAESRPKILSNLKSPLETGEVVLS